MSSWGVGPLPIRSNRISWKPPREASFRMPCDPYLLGQIGLVGNKLSSMAKEYSYFDTLPIRSKRISWKLRVFIDKLLALFPYLLGQIGLVGNVITYFLSGALKPYLLGQIGLVGN